MRVPRCRELVERAALTLVQLIALAGVASAEPEAVRIDYVAPAVCPDATAFLRLLRQRTTRFREATPSEGARTFVVRVTGLRTAFSGRLEIAGQDGSVAVRSVDSRVCGELTNALALMTALAIDPKALTPQSKPAEETSTEPPPKAAADKPERQAVTPASVAAVSRAPSQSPTPSSPWRWSVGVQGHATFVVTPNLGYGGDLFVDAEAPASSALGPAVRFGVFLNQSEIELASGPSARFRWIAPAIEGCPVRLKASTLRLSVHPCLALRMGVLYGEGRGMTQPRHVASFWSDVGPLLRLRFAAADSLNLEAQGGFMLPLYRPTFTILDNGANTSAFSVPAVGGSVGIGMTYGFP
jgi:hypothetical protein